MKMFSEMIGQKNETYFDPKVVLTQQAMDQYGVKREN